MLKLIKGILPQRFGNYWKQIKNKNNFNKDLINFTEKFIKSNSYKFVSNQWHLLNISDYNSIKDHGLDKYGSHISTHYFTFMNNYDYEHLKNLFINLNDNEVLNLKSNIYKRHNSFDYKTSINYNLLCLLLFENLKKKPDLFKSLSKLNDKTYTGNNHPFIDIDGNKISSDKIISLFDYEKIYKFYDSKETNNILEIGAGSGRLTECILTLKKNINYTICDIPPSIYIAYERMKVAFPNKKIGNLIDHNNPIELNKKILENDISFIFPHQLRFIEDNFFSIVIAVDCLHEMDKKTLEIYFDFINKITENFYFSIWKKTKNWHSKTLFKKTERLDFDKNDYNIPRNWKNVFKEDLIFPSTQVGLGYKIEK